MDNQRIEDRIRKLLALARNNPSQEEAANAFALAQEQATRAGLDLDEIDTAGASSEPPPPREVGSLTHRMVDTWDRAVAWKVRIGYAAAVANGCKQYIRSGSNGGGFGIYGDAQDVENAAALYHAILAQVEAMAAKAIHAYKTHPDHDPRHDESPRAYGAAWRLGCANKIAARLPARDAVLAKVRGELGSAAPSTALVRVDAAAEYLAKLAAAVEDYKRDTMGITRTARPIGKVSSARGYRAGSKAGDGVSVETRRALGKGGQS